MPRDAGRDPRWRGPECGTRHVRVTFFPWAERQTRDEESVSLGLVDVQQLDLRSIRRDLAQSCGLGEDDGVSLVEVHPASSRGAENGAIAPERDADTLRTLAGYDFYPVEWHETVTARNYRALVGSGDPVVLAWSGNGDFWGKDIRDRDFLEFGDNRTRKVVKDVVEARRTLQRLHKELGGIAEQWSPEEVDSSEDPDSVLRQLHSRVTRIRRDLQEKVMVVRSGGYVWDKRELDRLALLHRTCSDEWLPAELVEQVERESSILKSDLDFALAERANSKLAAILQGSEDAKRVRFLQSVVLLCLAGAALFTGLLAIPQEQFIPAHYPLAALWSIAIVLGSGALGGLLYWAYQREPLKDGMHRLLLGGAVVGLLLALALSLTGYGPAAPGLLFVLVFLVLGGLLVALSIRRESE